MIADCLDNINDYYDTGLKYARLKELGFAQEHILPNRLIKSNKFSNLEFIQAELSDKNKMITFFSSHKFDQVIHLAAQAGVRYSITNPYAYIESNIVGFLNVLEGCRQQGITRLIYASSSSVYGNNNKIPFNEDDNVDNPVSLYAATKKSNELLAYSYSNLYKFQTIGLRFFTAYGPWGRPDMAPMLFTNAILNDKPIEVFNEGNLERDFTYIDDIINGIIEISATEIKALRSQEIFNIGYGSPTSLMNFISELENQLGKPAKKIMREMQQGDVFKTYADTSKLDSIIKQTHKTDLVSGIKKFVDWYLLYEQQKNVLLQPLSSR